MLRSALYNRNRAMSRIKYAKSGSYRYIAEGNERVGIILPISLELLALLSEKFDAVWETRKDAGTIVIRK